MLLFLKRKYLWNDKKTQIYFMNLMAINFEIRRESFSSHDFNFILKTSILRSALPWACNDSSNKSFLLKRPSTHYFFYFNAINSELNSHINRLTKVYSCEQFVRFRNASVVIAKHPFEDVNHWPHRMYVNFAWFTLSLFKRLGSTMRGATRLAFVTSTYM